QEFASMVRRIHMSQDRYRDHQLRQFATHCLRESSPDLQHTTPHHGVLRFASDNRQQSPSVRRCGVALCQSCKMRIQCIKHPDGAVMGKAYGSVPDVTRVSSNRGAPTKELELLRVIIRNCSMSPQNVIVDGHQHSLYGLHWRQPEECRE